jgi:hypothetical protein
MKSIDYSPIDENILIAVTNDGHLQVYKYDDQIIYSSAIQDFNSIEYVSFSHDGLNVLFVQNIADHEILNIIPYHELIHDNIPGGINFALKTDLFIINYVVSPNYNHVAIFFSSKNLYNDPINGDINISHNDNKYFLNIYDFTVGYFRLVFQKEFDNRDVIFTLSEFNTIAIASKTIEYDEEEGGNEITEIAVYNIIAGNRVCNLFVDYIVKFIEYLPQIEPNYNKILLISELRQTQHIKIYDLEENFRLITNKNIDEYTIHDVDISQNGHIVIGTNEGLYYYTSLDEEPHHLLTDHIIEYISLSRSGEKIASIMIEYDLHIRYYYLIIYNFDETTIIYPRIAENDEDEIIRVDHELNECIVKPADPIKLLQEKDNNCFDIVDTGLDIQIGTYLSADKDNVVVFYKQASQPDFFAVCLTFTALKFYLKDPKSIYYKCEDHISLHMYWNNPPEYLKIPAPNNIYVNYNHMKTKYRQRQNMIFLETDGQRDIIEKTVSYDVSYTMNAISGWHCQKGTSINVYHIIF